MVVLEAFFSVSGKKRKEYVRIYHKRRKIEIDYLVGALLYFYK